MSRTTSGYISELFRESAKQLHVDYTRSTPTKIQTYATKTKPPFIGLINISKTGTTNDANTNLLSFVCTFVVVVGSKKDLSDEQLEKEQDDADGLGDDFLDFVKMNRNVYDVSMTMENVYRDGSYLGVGKAMIITLSIGDMRDYCKNACNTNTVTLDCE